MIADSSQMTRAGISPERLLTRMFCVPCHQKRHFHYLHFSIVRYVRTHQEHVYEFPFSFVSDRASAGSMKTVRLVYEATVKHIELSRRRHIIEVSHHYKIPVCERITHFLQGCHCSKPLGSGRFLSTEFGRVMTDYIIIYFICLKVFERYMKHISGLKLISVCFGSLEVCGKKAGAGCSV